MPETPMDRSQWARRSDGSEKGSGFLGLLARPDGRVSSEISIGTTDVDGTEREIPALVPSLTAAEVKTLLSMDNAKVRVPKAIAQKAADFARYRLMRGLPVFAREGEQAYHIYPELKRLEVPTSGFNDAAIRPVASHAQGTLASLLGLIR